MPSNFPFVKVLHVTQSLLPLIQNNWNRFMPYLLDFNDSDLREGDLEQVQNKINKFYFNDEQINSKNFKQIGNVSLCYAIWIIYS